MPYPISSSKIASLMATTPDKAADRPAPDAALPSRARQPVRSARSDLVLHDFDDRGHAELLRSSRRRHSEVEGLQAVEYVEVGDAFRQPLAPAR